MFSGKTSNSKYLSSANRSPGFTIHSFLQLHELGTIIIPILQRKKLRVYTDCPKSQSPWLVNLRIKPIWIIPKLILFISLLNGLPHSVENLWKLLYLHCSWCSCQHPGIAQCRSQTVGCPVHGISVHLQLKRVKKPLMHILLGALTSSAHAVTFTLVYKGLFFEDAQSFIRAGSLVKLGREYLSQATDGEANGQGSMTWGQSKRPVTPLGSTACQLLSPE